MNLLTLNGHTPWRTPTWLAAWLLLLSGLNLTAAAPPGRQPHLANPILPGYYADPSLVQFNGHVYIYATIDPWGGATLGCWESTDFKNWTYQNLNWPTKAACTSVRHGASSDALSSMPRQIAAASALRPS